MASQPRAPEPPATLPPALALPQPRTMSLEVAEVSEIGPSLRQISLRGTALEGFRHAPGQDLMLRLPLDRSGMVSRRYSIRRADPRAGRVDINVVLHGTGPAARWAASVRRGQLLPEVVGPRGKISLDAEAAWHLFVGDETYVPATLAMLEALPQGATATALLEVGGTQDRQPVEVLARARVDWLYRDGEGPGHADRLSRALAGLELPPGAGHVYIAAEVGVALRLRDELLARGLARAQISAKGYWSLGRPNASRGEPDPAPERPGPVR